MRTITQASLKSSCKNRFSRKKLSFVLVEQFFRLIADSFLQFLGFSQFLHAKDFVYELTRYLYECEKDKEVKFEFTGHKAWSGICMVLQNYVVKT